MFHTPAIRKVLVRMADYFASLGITPSASPETMLFTMQRALGSVPEEREAKKIWRVTNADHYAQYTRANGALYGLSSLRY